VPAGTASARGVVTVAGVDAGGQGSLVALVQRGRWREYEDGEGRSPGKKDGDAAHQGGRAPMRWWMG
jgi:hypothetical protein